MALHTGYSRKSSTICASNRAFVKQEREHAPSTGVQGAPDIDAFPFGFVSASGGTRTAQDMASWAAFFGKDKHAGARSQSTHVTFYPDLRNRRRAGLSLAATVAFNLGSWADTLAVLRLGIAVLTTKVAGCALLADRVCMSWIVTLHSRTCNKVDKGVHDSVLAVHICEEVDDGSDLNIGANSRGAKTDLNVALSSEVGQAK